MNRKLLEKYLSKFRGAESSYPFGPEALVYKIKGKMFALIAHDEETPRVTLKCSPANCEILVSQFKSIVPGYYMNKKHWITITFSNEVPEELIKDLANESYSLVVSKLPKKDRIELV